MLEAKFLMKIIRMASECLVFTMVKIQKIFFKEGDRNVAIFLRFFGAHCFVLAYPIPFSS